MAIEAEIAADLVEQKAKSIESLVSMMEADGLLADQIEATKKGHLDSAVVSLTMQLKQARIELLNFLLTRRSSSI